MHEGVAFTGTANKLGPSILSSSKAIQSRTRGTTDNSPVRFRVPACRDEEQVPGKNQRNDSLLPQARAQRSKAPQEDLSLQSPSLRRRRKSLAQVRKPWVKNGKKDKRRRCDTESAS